MHSQHLLTRLCHILAVSLLLICAARAEVSISSLTVADQLTEFMQRYKNESGDYEEFPWFKQTTTLQATLKLTGDSVIDPVMSPYTNITLQMGSLSFTGQLSHDSSFTQDNMNSKRSVFLRTHVDGSGKPAGTSGVKLSWTATQVTISLTATNMDSSPMGSPLSESLVVQDAPASPSRAVKASLPLSITFDSIRLTQKKIFMLGTVEVKAQKISGTTRNFHHIRLTGAADITPPTVTASVPDRGMAKAGQDVKISGKVADGHGIRRIGIIHKHVSQELTNGVTTVKGPPEGAAAGWWGPSEKTFEVMVTPSEGANDVIVWAEHIDGNRSEKTVRITLPLPASLAGRWCMPLYTSEENGHFGIMNLLVSPQGGVTGSLRMVGMTSARSFAGVWQGGRLDLYSDKGKSSHLFVFGQLATPEQASVPTLRISVIKNEAEFLTGEAIRLPYSATNKLPASSPLLGRFHTVSPGDLFSEAVGAGHFALVTSPTGATTLTGKLCDGTAVTASADIDESGRACVFAPLYGNKGGVQVEAAFALMSSSTVWHRPASLPDRQFPAGASTSRMALLHRYTAPAKDQRILGLTSAKARAEWQGDGMEVSSIVQPVLVSLANKITPDGASPSFIATFAPATGLITGSFKLPTTPAVTASFAAIVVGNEAVGHYIAPAQAGQPLKRCGHFLLKGVTIPTAAPDRPHRGFSRSNERGRSSRSGVRPPR